MVIIRRINRLGPICRFEMSPSRGSRSWKKNKRTNERSVTVVQPSGPARPLQQRSLQLLVPSCASCSATRYHTVGRAYQFARHSSSSCKQHARRRTSVPFGCFRILLQEILHAKCIRA